MSKKLKENKNIKVYLLLSFFISASIIISSISSISYKKDFLCENFYESNYFSNFILEPIIGESIDSISNLSDRGLKYREQELKNRYISKEEAVREQYKKKKAELNKAITKEDEERLLKNQNEELDLLKKRYEMDLEGLKNTIKEQNEKNKAYAVKSLNRDSYLNYMILNKKDNDIVTNTSYKDLSAFDNSINNNLNQYDAIIKFDGKKREAKIKFKKELEIKLGAIKHSDSYKDIVKNVAFNVNDEDNVDNLIAYYAIKPLKYEINSNSRLIKGYSKYISENTEFLISIILSIVSFIVLILSIIKYKKIKNLNCDLERKYFVKYDKLSIEWKLFFILISFCLANSMVDFILKVLFTTILMISIYSMYRYVKLKDGKEDLLNESKVINIIRNLQSNYKIKPIVKKVKYVFLYIFLYEVIVLLLILIIVQDMSGGFIMFIMAQGVLFITMFIYVSKNVIYLNKIVVGIEKIYNGDKNYKIDIKENSPLKSLAENINNIKDGLNVAIENEIKSQRMKTELITNLSHDLKTPLTSIINYVDLLKREDVKPDVAKDYIEILDRKAKRLKVLIEDLFEAAKASSGDLELNMEKLEVGSLLKQTLGELEEKIVKSSLDFRINIPENKIYILGDGRKLWRVFENIIGNALKYSLKGTRVYVDVEEKEEKVQISMKNISAYELNFNSDEIIERFKRGDKSRNTEGSGLGLAISKSLVELQNGLFEIEIDGDLFKVVIIFNQFK